MTLNSNREKSVPPPGNGTAAAPGATAESRGVADWLCLAATPTFAIMALLTGAGDGPHEMMSPAAHGALPLSGMAWMYILMSAFHSAPWLKLVSSRPSRRSRSSPGPGPAGNPAVDRAAPSR